MANMSEKKFFSEEDAEKLRDVVRKNFEETKSQTETGIVFGVHQTTISNWLKEKHSFDPDSARKIARAYGKSLTEILGYDPFSSQISSTSDEGIASGEPPVDKRPVLSGTNMGMMLLEKAAKARLLPNLERCIDFYRYDRAPRTWLPSTIIAAAGGALGEEDMSTGEWAQALTRLEEIHGMLRKKLDAEMVNQRHVPGQQ